MRALVRPDASADALDWLRARGATPVVADPSDVSAVAEACVGAGCVVSALNGLREVVVDRQGVLLDAAVLAGVPRFIPSDFAVDFTRTTPGRNRNFDLRREFAARADRAPIDVTSILTGAFMDMLCNEMPTIQPRIRRVLHWGDVDQPLDFTAKCDVAAFTAAAALDPDTPRVLRVAGATVSARGLAETLTEVTGRRYRTLRLGGIGALSALIRVARTVAPQPGEVFPAWQGMQYMRDMSTGEALLHPLDNDRYPHLRWTRLSDHLAATMPAAVPKAQ